MASYRISFQLYSARKFPPLEAHLEALATIGYDAVEPYAALIMAGTDDFRRRCEALGLACPTAHVPLALLDDDRPKAIAVAQELAMETVIIPSVPQAARPGDAAGWADFARRLGEHAAALGEAGLKLAWHNHAYEYERLDDGSQPIAHIVGTEGVLFEPDIGWIIRAGGDPAAEIARFPGKVAAFHVKDTAPAGVTVDDGWTDVGAGTVDWQGLWPTIAAAGSDLLVLEHDNPSDWRGFAARSYETVAGLAGRA